MMDTTAAIASVFLGEFVEDTSSSGHGSRASERELRATASNETNESIKMRVAIVL